MPPFFKALPTLFIALLFPHISALPITNTATACDCVHVFLARGTGPASCGYEDIQYPASFLPEYCISEGLGLSHGTAQSKAYAAACPASQLVLSGYSQGAQILGNILGGQAAGSEGCTNQNTTGLPSPTAAPAANIKAVMLFGDLTHVANQTYNTANGTRKDGFSPRTGAQLERPNVYSDKLQSWCLSNDPVCAQGDDIDTHVSYFDVFFQEAADWVAGKLEL